MKISAYTLTAQAHVAIPWPEDALGELRITSQSGEVFDLRVTERGIEVRSKSTAIAILPRSSNAVHVEARE